MKEKIARHQWIIHPFIFVTLPIIASPLATYCLPEELLAALLVFELIMLGYFLLLRLFQKDVIKAGIVASLTVPLVFCFRAFQVSIDAISIKLTGSACEDGLTLLLYLLLWTCLLKAAMKGEFKFGKALLQLDFLRFNNALNILSIVLLTINALPAVGYHLKAISVQRRMLAQLTSADKQFSPNLETAKPDVYYLILDAFAHTDTLKDIWKYDNSEFIDFLKDKGFHIVPEAFSNYDRTTLSVPSSLNMQYLDFIPEQLGIQWCDDTLNYRLMQDNRVSRLFHKLGYKYVNVFSGWTPTEFVPTAEVNIIKNSGSYISMTLMLLTVVSGFEKYWPITLDSYAETRLVPFKYIDEIASIPGPKFVLIHSLLSHPPNIFDENGNKTQLSRATLNELAVDGYLPQIKYCQKMVKKLVTSVLERPGPKPIIIIQSDHGPLFATGANQKRFYNENMRILMALHFPDQQVEPQRLSPVNVFRLLFNTYFGTKLPLLPDRSFCGPPGDQLNQYHWKDVTNQLEFAR